MGDDKYVKRFTSYKHSPPKTTRNVSRKQIRLKLSMMDRYSAATSL